MSDFLTELRERRVLPAVGVYAAGCWVVVEIVDRLAERHHFSPNLTDLVFWGLYSLIPAVLLIAWSYGRPGKDKATTAQKIGVPLNIIATAGLLFTVFGSKDLGATAEVIDYVDEQGVANEAVVPKAGYRQRLAIFFYENETGDPEQDWLQYGVAELLTQDLQQDPYLVVASPYEGWGGGYFGRLKAAGFDDGIAAPVSLMREISQDANRQYFTEGTLTQEGDELVLLTRVWDVESMVQVAEIREQGWDIYRMVDDTSVEIRSQLEVPSMAMKSQEDLPLAETYGESEDALKAYISGLNLRLLDNDIPGAMALMDEALAEDGNFVMANFMKAMLLIQGGNLPGAVPELEQVQRQEFRLPSRDRATVKALYYRATGQSDVLLQFLRLQAQILDDGRAHRQLGEILMVNGELDEARHHFEQALIRDSLNVSLYLALSDLARASGDIDEAIQFAREYQSRKPTETDAHLKLGDLLRDTGELEEAETQYQQAALLESDAVSPLLRLQLIAERRGDDTNAERLLLEAQRRAQTASQLATVHMAAGQYAGRLGRIDEAVAQFRAAEPHIMESQPPFVTAITIHASVCSQLLRKGDLEGAIAVLEEANALVPEPPLNQFLKPMDATIAAESGNTAAAWEALGAFEELLTAMKFDGLKFQVPILEGTILFREGKYDEATLKFQQAIVEIDTSFIAGDVNASGMSLLLGQLADAEIHAGQLDEAERTLERAFRSDAASPNLWASRARLQKAKGQNKLAEASANYALTLWSEADPALKEMLLVQELLNSISGADA